MSVKKTLTVERNREGPRKRVAKAKVVEGRVVSDKVYEEGVLSGKTPEKERSQQDAEKGVP